MSKAFSPIILNFSWFITLAIGILMALGSPIADSVILWAPSKILSELVDVNLKEFQQNSMD